VGIYITDKKTGFPFSREWQKTPSFPRKWESILLIKIMDSRFHGNDRMVDSRLHGNGKIESTLVIDKIKIMDSRFHGNDKMGNFK